MPSHDMTVRGEITIASSVTLPMIIEMMGDMLDEFSIRLTAGSVVPDRGEIPFDAPDDAVTLDAHGSLRVNVSVWGQSCMGMPHSVERFVERLDRLATCGAVIELVDHDASAASDDAITARFVGANEAQRQRARIGYAMRQAQPWLEGLVSSEALAGMERMALLDARLE